MKWLIKSLKFLFFLTLIGAVVGIGAVIGAYFHVQADLPSIDNLRNVKLQVPLRVYSRDQKLIAEFGEKRRVPLSYEAVPKQMVQAFLAAEDDRFFEHPGVDYHGLIRAAAHLLLTGERRQGGSTITMQVARNFFLSREKTYTRKLNEIFLAIRIEQELSKQEILELYLNKIYLGNRAYGVGAAAQIYYGTTVENLTLPQIAMIAGLPKAPSRFNPLADSKRALVRRNYVLGRMAQLGYITGEQRAQEERTPITARLYTAAMELHAPYVAEMVRAEMVGRFGDDAYITGYQVYTSLDSRLQHAADRALRKNLQVYDKRHGYRGTIRHIEGWEQLIAEDRDQLLADTGTVADLVPGLVTSVEDKTATVYKGQGNAVTLTWEGLSWAAPYINENRVGDRPKAAADVIKPGDLIYLLGKIDKDGKDSWRLAQVPAVESAMVALDPADGAILAMTGGYDFFASKFNRATQARRQPGSGFKPFIYSAALEEGYTTASLINDAPIVFEDRSLEDSWRPENYSGKFFGPTRLRMALTQSRNLVSIRLLRSIGISKALDYVTHFGFDADKLPHNLSLALGSGDVTPLEMARGYAVLANGGYLVEPYFIDRILDDEQSVIYEANPKMICDNCEEAITNDSSNSESGLKQPQYAPRTVTAQNHYLITSMMQDVIKFGTARRARSLGRNDLAGKTGTTNDQRDAWFNGFHPNLVAITWVGFDDNTKLGRGEVGGQAALPAWIDFMQQALHGVPEKPVPMPADMVTIRIDPRTGKRAPTGQDDAIFEYFRTDNVPEELPATSSGRPTGTGNTDDPTEGLF